MATGLDGTFTNDNRVTLQAQWDLAASQDKALVIVEPGTYKLTCTGSGDTRCCLTPSDPDKRYELWLGPGVDLKMADGQVADNNRVGAIITIADHTAGGYIGWPFGAPTMRAQGGRLVGNTAGQTGWTVASGESGTKYAQGGTHAGILGRDTVAGGGSNHWSIDNIEINDFYGNSLAWVADLVRITEYHTTTYDIHITRVKTDRCGEGIIWGGLYQSSMRHCTNVARTGINVGDFHEPATSTDCYCEDLEAIVAEGNGEFIGGGAVCDVYGSHSIRVKGIYGNGVNCLLQCHGNGSVGTAQELECGTVIAEDLTAVDCGSYPILWGQVGDITIRNVTVVNMRSVATSPALGGYGVTIANRFKLLMENVQLYNCTSIACDGAGLFRFRNVTATCRSGWVAHFLGATNNTSPIIHLDNVNASGYPIGLLFSGTSAPTGKWVNVDLSGCTLLKIMQDTATLAGVEIPEGMTGDGNFYYFIGQPAGQDGQPIQGVRAINGFWLNQTYTTLPVGHKYQKLRIAPNNSGTLSPSSTLKLAGNTSVALAPPDVMELIYDTANGYWRELSRSINH